MLGDGGADVEVGPEAGVAFVEGFAEGAGAAGVRGGEEGTAGAVVGGEVEEWAAGTIAVVVMVGGVEEGT